MKACLSATPPKTQSIEAAQWRSTYEGEQQATALIKAKVEKQQEIEAAFHASEKAPVHVGPYTVKGGASSGYALKAQLDMAIKYAELMPELKITTVDFFRHQRRSDHRADNPAHFTIPRSGMAGTSALWSGRRPARSPLNMLVR